MSSVDTCGATIGCTLAAALLVGQAADEPLESHEPLETEPQVELVAPRSVSAEFNPLPALWGLQELNVGTTLEDLDAAVVIYLSERARFDAAEASGTIYFVAGEQLVVDGTLTDERIDEILTSVPCVCALDFEATAAVGALHAPAGVVRLDGAPTVTTEAPGRVRVELALSAEGQPDRVTLRRLVCHLAGETSDTVTAVLATLPRFARLVRKQQQGFVDPPIDDRFVGLDEMARRARAGELVFLVSQEELWPGGRRADDPAVPLRWDANEPGTRRPGLFTLFDEMSTGKRYTIDYSGYWSDIDPYFHRLSRKHGIYFRNPTYWP